MLFQLEPTIVGKGFSRELVAVFECEAGSRRHPADFVRGHLKSAASARAQIYFRSRTPTVARSAPTTDPFRSCASAVRQAYSNGQRTLGDASLEHAAAVTKVASI